jgi:hypothetical protein
MFNRSDAGIAASWVPAVSVLHKPGAARSTWPSLRTAIPLITDSSALSSQARHLPRALAVREALQPIHPVVARQGFAALIRLQAVRCPGEGA